jgi:hypothetical protein
MPSNQFFANTFGQWMPNGPQSGQQTLQGQQTAADIAQNWSQMFGQYYAPGTAPTQGAATLAAQNQANQLGLAQGGLTGWYTNPAGSREQTLAGQQQQWQQGFAQQGFEAQQRQLQQQNAQNYLQLLASLRGPADWAKYQQVLGTTPGGMRDLYAAAMGQYVPGGGATTGVQPQAASLQTMMQQVQGTPGQYEGYVTPQQQGGYQYYNAAGPAQTYQQVGGPQYANMEQAQAARAQQAQQGGTQVWGSGIGVGAQQPTPAQQQQAQGGGTNMYGGQQQQYNLPAPNQISSQAWNAFTPSQQQMMLGEYESRGWDKNDVQALYNQSLPKYAQNTASTGSWGR